MSLINDALKQARKVPPRTPNSLPPLRPVDTEPPSVSSWLIPVIIAILILSAIFFTGWIIAHRAVGDAVIEADAQAASQSPVEVIPPVKPAMPEPTGPLNPPDSPVLQGIFYSPTAPSAIVDGKTVRPGDAFRQYKVKEISKFTVTLVGPDKKEIKLGLNR